LLVININHWSDYGTLPLLCSTSSFDKCY
jgi:hypothetical protein